MDLFVLLFRRLLGLLKKTQPEPAETIYLVPAPPATPTSPEERALCFRETAAVLRDASEKHKGSQTQRLFLHPLEHLEQKIQTLEQPPPSQPNQPIAA